MGGLDPDLISDLPGMEMASSPRGHEFSGRYMRSKGLFSGFVKFR